MFISFIQKHERPIAYLASCCPSRNANRNKGQQEVGKVSTFEQNDSKAI